MEICGETETERTAAELGFGAGSNVNTDCIAAD
jgi:hypothetical protein